MGNITGKYEEQTENLYLIIILFACTYTYTCSSYSVLLLPDGLGAIREGSVYLKLCQTFLSMSINSGASYCCFIFGTLK